MLRLYRGMDSMARSLRKKQTTASSRETPPTAIRSVVVFIVAIIRSGRRVQWKVGTREGMEPRNVRGLFSALSCQGDQDCKSLGWPSVQFALWCANIVVLIFVSA